MSVGRGRRKLGAACLAGVLAVAAGGCGFSQNVYETSGFSSPETPYGRALASATRRAELYEGLDTVAKGWATWKSPELRQALVEASIRAYGAQGEAAETLRKDEERAGRNVWEFHLALYTPKKQWNDLEAGDSLWKVRVLLKGGRTFEPAKITALAKTDKSPVQYPYVTPWTREYSLVFPKDEDIPNERPTLLLSGPLGKMQFVF